MRVEERPWGKFTVIHPVEAVDGGMQFQVKTLEIQPEESISLQLHHRRAEHWVVVQGEGKAYTGKRIGTIGIGSHVFVRYEEKHRLRATGDIPLKIVEVQIGDDIRDDDIERFEDKYGRVKEKDE